MRFNISEEKCLITIKVFTKSLFHREYEHESHLGCLRSTIAASMLYRLVGEDSNLKVVDNFCGSGTFLCEALMLGNEVYGNDIDKSAVDVTKRNLNRIRKGNTILRIMMHLIQNGIVISLILQYLTILG